MKTQLKVRMFHSNQQQLQHALEEIQHEGEGAEDHESRHRHAAGLQAHITRGLGRAERYHDKSFSIVSNGCRYFSP